VANKHITAHLRAETNHDYVTCHTLRHSWDPIGSGDRRPEFGSLLCLRCERCGTLRYDRFSRITGERIGNPQYIYPDAYRDTEGHDMNWWRQNMAEFLWTDGFSVDADDVGVRRRRRRTG
jgi:hypothetical protein